MNCKTITNATDTISFMNNFGSHTCYSIGKQYKSFSNATAIQYIRFKQNTQNTLGSLYCEFILCGSQSGLTGFVNKYECTINPNGVVRSNNATVAENTDLTKINIGQSETATVPRLTKNTSTTSFANDTITFSVTPGTTGANLYLFYRILNGGFQNYNYTITLL